MKPMSFSYNFPAIVSQDQLEINPFEKLHEELAEIDDAVTRIECLGERHLSLVTDEQTLAKQVNLGNASERQLIELQHDVREAYSFLCSERDHLLEEVLDLYHATETLLRHFSSQEVFEMRNKVIEKNEKRGYYEED